MQAFKAMEPAVHAAPDQRISLTDPDSRAMATNGKGTGIVGYNVQTAVDTHHHLIVAHEVTNVGHDRDQLSNMAGHTKAEMDVETLEVLADRGYFSGEEILACEPLGATPYVPKPLTSGLRPRAGSVNRTSSTSRRGRLSLSGGTKLTRHFTSVENGMILHSYWTGELYRLRAEASVYNRQGTADQPVGA